MPNKATRRCARLKTTAKGKTIMTKLLTGLLVLTSLATYGEDGLRTFIFQNRSNPEDTFTLDCEDLGCSSMTVTTTVPGHKASINQLLVNRSDLESLKNYAMKSDYGATKQAHYEMSRNFDNGDVFDGVYRAVFELPSELIGDLYSDLFNRARYQRQETLHQSIYQDRRGARRILSNIDEEDSDKEIISLRRGLFKKMFYTVVRVAK